MKKYSKQIIFASFIASQALILTACGGGSSASGNSGANNSANAETPSVKLVSPADNSTSVALQPTISIQFSAAVNNVSTTTLTLHESSPTGAIVPVSKIDALANNTYSFTPDSTLNKFSKYYVEVAPSITSVDGNKSVEQTDFEFTTAKNFAYAVESTATLICSIDDNSQQLFGCTKGASIGGSTIKFSPTNSYVYVVNKNSGLINVCSYNSNNGALSNCNAADKTFSGPDDITFDTNGNYAFIPTITGKNVNRCQVDQQSGGLSNCVASNQFSGAPSSIAFSDDNTRAYVTMYQADFVDVCNYDSLTGKFTNCTSTGNSFSGPAKIVINSAKSTALVTNANPTASNVLSCDIQPDGQFGICTPTGSGFSEPYGITFNADNSYAYVANVGNNSVSTCQVDNVGTLSNCTNSNGINTQAIYGVAVYSPASN